MHTLISLFFYLYLIGAIIIGCVHLLIACLDFALENVNRKKELRPDWKIGFSYVLWSTLGWPHFIYAFLKKKTVYK